MNQPQQSNGLHDTPTNPRWLLIALASIGVHQIQSLIEEPRQRRFRLAGIALLVVMPLTLLLPERRRGILWTLLGLPPITGAIVGHLLPIIRTRRIPRASETAPFNLAGGALLSALGASLVLTPPPHKES